MIRIGILVLAFIAASVFAAPADVRADIFEFDVTWSIHSTFSLANGSGGTADIHGQGPGRLTTSTAPNGARLFDTLSFSDGKSGGSAGPLVNGGVILDEAQAQFTTGLPAAVEGAPMQRPRNFVTFTTDDGLTMFDALFTRQNECISLGGCGSLGALAWQSDLVAHGVRRTAAVTAFEPGSAAVVLVGLGLTIAARRRRR